MNKTGHLVMAFFTLALITEPAYAYLDPGTGGMLLQLLLGGLAGLAVVVKLYWLKIKLFFGFGKDEPKETEEEDN